MPYKNRFDRKKWLQKREAELRELVGNITEQYGCQLCDEKDRVVLDFHHLDSSSKEFGIGDALVKLYAWDRIWKEINKCVILCANCHRRVHAGKRQVNESMICHIDAGGSVLVTEACL